MNIAEKRVSERYIPSGYTLNFSDENIHVYYGRGGRDNKPAMLVFKAKAKNKLQWFTYRTEKDREDRKGELVQSFNERAVKVAERKVSRLQPHNIEVGAIFYASWGYDQTNINFYQVIATTEKTVTVQEISGAREYQGDMHGDTSAVKDSFILNTELGQRYPEKYQPFRRVVNMGGGQPSIKIESWGIWAWLDDGSKHGWSSWA